MIRPMRDTAIIPNEIQTNASVPVVRYQRTNHYKEGGKLHG